MYVVIEKPEHTLDSYRSMMNGRGKLLSSMQLEEILVGCCRGIEYLRERGQEVMGIK